MESIKIKKEINGCYFKFYLDEDDPNYDEKFKKHIENKLCNVMDPIIIYEYEEFKSKKLKDKYKDEIETELEKYNINNECNKKWKDIYNIVKKEIKYERDKE